jgi:hypothetical protein
MNVILVLVVIVVVVGECKTSIGDNNNSSSECR